MPKPTIENFGSFEKENSGDSGDPINVTVTFAGTNRYCVFIVAFNNNDLQDVSSVVIDPGGGDELALAFVTGSRFAVGPDDGQAETWSVKDPPVGTFTVRAILSLTTRINEKACGGCWALSDVDQDAPITDQGGFSCTCANGNDTLTSTVDHLLFGGMYLEDGTTISIDAPAVEDVELVLGQDAAHYGHTDGTATSTKIEWSYSSDKSAGSMISIKGGAVVTARGPRPVVVGRSSATRASVY